MPVATKVGYRTETSEYVQFRWCPAGQSCLSEIVVYKTDPASYRVTPCALAEGTQPSLALIGDLDVLEGVAWEVV